MKTNEEKKIDWKKQINWTEKQSNERNIMQNKNKNTNYNRNQMKKWDKNAIYE